MNVRDFNGGGRLAPWDCDTFSPTKGLRGDQSNANEWGFNVQVRMFRVKGHTEIKEVRFAVEILRGGRHRMRLIHEMGCKGRPSEQRQGRVPPQRRKHRTRCAKPGRS